MDEDSLALLIKRMSSWLGGDKMQISGVDALLGMQKDLTKTQTQKTGEDFKEILDRATQNNDDKELKEACDELESYMLGMVFKQMKESMLQDDEEALIPKGDYTNTFEDMMINTFSENMVKAGGIGLSDQLYKQIKTAYGAQMNVSQEVSEENQAAVASSAQKFETEI